jgi:phosphoribosylamine--glycine ligase
VFIGLIKVNEEPMVIEYNCRMGDPETEVVIPRLENDLVGLLVATANQKLDEVQLSIDPRTTATVMAVSGGYPGHFEKGFEIYGLKHALPKDSLLFQAGTTAKDGAVVSSGGRVLCVTSYDKSIKGAVEKSLAVMEDIDFEGIYFRKDIGYEFMQ